MPRPGGRLEAIEFAPDVRGREDRTDVERTLHVFAQPAADLVFVLLVHRQKTNERIRLAGKVLRRADRNAGAWQEQALALLLVVDREVDEIREFMGIGEGAGAAAGAVDGDLGAVGAGLGENRAKTRAVLPGAPTEFLADAGRRGGGRHVVRGAPRCEREGAASEIVFLHRARLEAVARQQRQQRRLSEVADVLLPQDREVARRRA